jgi:hypothetical protein
VESKVTAGSHIPRLTDAELRVSLAANADSMATSFTGVFAELGDVLLDVRIEDQQVRRRHWRGIVTTLYRTC